MSRAQQDPSVGQLVGQLSEQTSRLVKDEINLAQAELKEKAGHAGKGFGGFGAAGLLAFFGLAVLITTAILALALVLPAWAAALVVGVVLLVAAGVAALVGKKQISQAKPVPEQAIDSVKTDVREMKERGRS